MIVLSSYCWVLHCWGSSLWHSTCVWFLYRVQLQSFLFHLGVAGPYTTVNIDGSAAQESQSQLSSERKDVYRNTGAWEGASEGKGEGGPFQSEAGGRGTWEQDSFGNPLALPPCGDAGGSSDPHKIPWIREDLTYWKLPGRKLEPWHPRLKGSQVAHVLSFLSTGSEDMKNSSEVR